MPVAEQRNLFNPKVEALAEQYAGAMGTLAGQKFTPADITAMAPQVAPQTALQQQATQLTGTGIGAYQPYMAQAQQAGTTAGAGLGLAQTGLGIAGQELTGAQGALGIAGTTTAAAQPFIGAAGTGLAGAGTTLGGVQGYIGAAGTGLGAAAGLTGTGTGTGAGSIASYMSPYQSQVIDTSLAEFDRQAAMRQQGISDQAVAMGGYGGGREGVMQSEYQLGSDRNRAMLQAQMQQQGFGQAAGMRQQDLANQMMLSQGQLGLGQATGSLAQQKAALAQGQLGLGQAQLGLGSAQAGQAGAQAGMAGQRAQLAQQQAGLGQAQLGLGQYQTGLGGALQGFQGTDIGRAGQVGSADQAYAQAVKDADREKARMGLYEPYERMGFLGSGLTGLMGGMGPQYQFGTQPNASPLATALGIGSTLGGIYGNVVGATNPGGYTASDARLKTDIELKDKSPSGVNVYSFKYKGDDKTYQGVMAQEVPWASIKGNDGYLKVDYSKVDVDFKRLN